MRVMRPKLTSLVPSLPPPGGSVVSDHRFRLCFFPLRKRVEVVSSNLMVGKRRIALVGALLLLTACLDWDPPRTGGDGDSDGDRDLDADTDGDSDVDADYDPCVGVSCSGHGRCVSDGDNAGCVCDDGYRAEGLSCVPVGADGDADVDGDDEQDIDSDADSGLDGDVEAGPCSSCEPDEECCGEACVDLDSDPANCGECGLTCEVGEVCDDGTCTSVGCSGELVDCDGACVDTRTDASHCGRCGNECPPGNDCFDGECVCQHEDPPVACEPGLTCCLHVIPEFGGCVDTAYDVQHCGSCNHACSFPFPVCIAGVCASG